MPRPRVDLLVVHLAQAATLAGPRGPRAGAAAREPAVVADAAIAIRDGRVVEVGRRADLAATYDAACILDGGGGVALPGFVDAHTHLVFAGNRHDEWEERLEGVRYEDIAARGGGIRASVRRLRAAPLEDLVDEAARRLDRMLAAGTTTAEVKTGYGLSTDSEAKSLDAIERLAATHPVRLVATFLGAHEVPDEHRADREGYLRLLTEEMLPRFAGRARFCDVFCERGVFSVAEARRVLAAGRAHGLRPKLHADELSGSGGAELAAEVGAISADHLCQASDAGIRAMAKAGVVGVLLPGTAYFLRLAERPRVAAMREHGLALALATDCNPGSCPTPSMAMAMSLGCQLYGLTPAEALTAATINAAHAIGEGERAGSLEPGKAADLAIYDCADWREVPYTFGTSLARAVIVGGRLVWENGRRCA